MGKEFDEEDEDDLLTITLELDDGRELECRILSVFEAGGRDYIALFPLDEDFTYEGADDEDGGQVFLYRYNENENGDFELENILSDEEFEVVSDAFDEWLDSQEYDEYVDAEDFDE